MKKFLITILTLMFLLSFSYTNAQMSTSIDGITITSVPINPEPGENVIISIESSLLDLDSASTVWLSNGKNIYSGIGKKEIIVKAPMGGKKLIVTVVLKDHNGREVQKAVVLKSGSVDLIWEPINYTPPFYKGVGNLVYQNKIKLIAIPHLYSSETKELDPKNLVYQWRLGGKYIDGASGYGKQSITIDAGDIPKHLDISIDVYNREETQTAVKKISLKPKEPSVSFYEMNPLYGIYFNKALSTKISLEDSEMTILSAPFGFSFKKNQLVYTWSINNTEQSSLSNNQSITLRKKDDTSGSSDINVEVRSNENIMQGAQSSFGVDFKKKETVNNNKIF